MAGSLAAHDGLHTAAAMHNTSKREIMCCTNKQHYGIMYSLEKSRTFIVADTYSF